MLNKFQSIIKSMILPDDGMCNFTIFEAESHFNVESNEETDIAKSLNAAFLISMAGEGHPSYERARQFIKDKVDSADWKDAAEFYLSGIDHVKREIEKICHIDADFADRLRTLSEWMLNNEIQKKKQETVEKLWSVFFPEGVGIQQNRKKRVSRLRSKRLVNISKLNSSPITDPLRQVLFTSNVLLTIPPASKPMEEYQFSEDIRKKLSDTIHENQQYWYDHPIQIGVEPDKNEVLYGLRGLDEAVEYEKNRNNVDRDSRLTCVLSVSVTHNGLHKIAKAYLAEEFVRTGGLKNIDIFVFTEEDTKEIIDEILVPASQRYLQNDDAKELLQVFGVDGAYGRHYSFLKSIAAFWNIFIKQEVCATYKIDLDQVFPQCELVEACCESAFQNFKTPLWGAEGTDSKGKPVELGMIAGALVNQKDIDKSIFTPDVPFFSRELSPDEYIFSSNLPQALSTEAEMLTRYNDGDIDGEKTCIQRIHVTGGTVGILVDSLRAYRPFTPSFIGRAEDQAYILSVLNNPYRQLAYAHKDGLIMRHDKEAFAQEAMESAYIGKLVGDYIRILYFSEYARALSSDIEKIKDVADPFTGCFISRIPATVVYLRFALKAASLFKAGKDDQGIDFIKVGAQRISNALDFIDGDDSQLKKQYNEECHGWNLYFDVLSALEKAIESKDEFALELRQKARDIISGCSIRFDR